MEVTPTSAGTALILLGFALVVVGTLVVVAGSVLGEGGVETEAGGVVFVGPIPVVFGSSKGAVWIAIALAALMLAFFFVFYR